MNYYYQLFLELIIYAKLADYTNYYKTMEKFENMLQGSEVEFVAPIVLPKDIA